MSNARGKSIDNTHLSIDTAEERGFLHRDYIAHCFRWSHVVKYMYQRSIYKEADVLDIGCGREQPLAKLLYSSRLAPASYTGVDVNVLQKAPQLARCDWVELHGQTDICKWNDQGSTFRVITCFEVLEHVEPKHSFAILKRIYDLLEPEGIAFISTPCYDPGVGAAANHVNEMSYLGLRYLIQRSGLHVENVFGTFASMRDYKDHLYAMGHGEVFELLHQYYDSNVLATIFAPMFPRESRNCLWRLQKGRLQSEIPFIASGDVYNKSHSSSDQWVPFIQELTQNEPA